MSMFRLWGTAGGYTASSCIQYTVLVDEAYVHSVALAGDVSMLLTASEWHGFSHSRDRKVMSLCITVVHYCKIHWFPQKIILHYKICSLTMLS